MTCDKCQGLTVPCYMQDEDEPEWVIGMRCVSCGTIHERVMDQNKRHRPEVRVQVRLTTWSR